nr:MAG TPA: hypothetical protein [Caudoviricetes sp.]DAT28339.1 MAG TPA: hypothetical protein [Caudoviricetes sp.]
MSQSDLILLLSYLFYVLCPSLITKTVNYYVVPKI